MATPNVKKSRAKDFDDLLIESLKDPELASEYINAAFEDGDIQLFLAACADVAKAQGHTRLSKKSGINRVNIYKMFSGDRNPSIGSIQGVLKAAGLTLRVEPAHRQHRPAFSHFSRRDSQIITAGLDYAVESPSGLRDYVSPESDDLSSMVSTFPFQAIKSRECGLLAA